MAAADSAASEPIRFRIVGAENGMPLKQVLAKRLPGTNLARAGAIVKAGGVYLNNVRIRIPSVRVAEGERLTVYVSAADSTPLELDALRVVVRGPDFAVVDKPAGVPVAATKARARGTVSEGLVRVLTREGVRRPYVGVVHGLVPAASGLALFTLRGQDRKSVHGLFRAAPCRRTFRARAQVPEHERARETWTCELPLHTTRAGTVRLAASGEAQKPATTVFRRLEREPSSDRPQLLEIVLEEGSCAQIVVHAAAVGLRIVSRETFQSASQATDELGTNARSSLALHAGSLEFRHPVTGETVRAESELPAWARLENPGA